LSGNQKLFAALLCSAKDFSKRFVSKHETEVPDDVKAFEGKIKFEGFGDREFEHFS
jgi:mTERF domain-containing protein